MVLIIRNSRILSSRHSRIKRLFNYIQKDQPRQNHKESPSDIEQESTNMSLVRVLGTLFIYSVAMFTLPFAVFFGVQHVMDNEFHTDRFVTNCVSVLAAVVTVNLIISCYAYQALHEPDDAPEEDDTSESSSKESLNKKDD